MLSKNISKENNDYQDSSLNVLSWFLSPKSSLLDVEGEHSVYMMAKSIYHLYKSRNIINFHLIRFQEIKNTLPEANNKTRGQLVPPSV